jgi:hypothetical protein
LFLFCISVRVEIVICIHLNILLLSGMAYRAELFRVSVRCWIPTSISLFEQFPSKHWELRLFITQLWKSFQSDWR